MSEIPEWLGKLAERSSNTVSPLAAVAVFGYFYVNLPADRAESDLISMILATALAISTFCSITKMVCGWPKIPVIDNDNNA